MTGVIAITCPGVLFKGLPVVFSDLARGRFWRVETELEGLFFEGSTGMALHGSSLWIATTQASGQGCLICFDVANGSVRTINGKFSDPHSILIKEGHVLVVSTADNAIYSYPIDGQQTGDNAIYKLDESSEDVLHINGICEWEEDTLVGMFGRRPKGKRWSDAKDGGIIRLSDLQPISRLMHPHSVGQHHNRLLAAESLTNSVVDVLREDVLMTTDTSLGYLRGIASWSDFLAFGLSERRENREGLEAFTLGIAKYSGDRLEHVVSLVGPRGYLEIYDLVYLDRLPHGNMLPVDAPSSSDVPFLGPDFTWERMAKISFESDVWTEKVRIHDIPLNVSGVPLKLAVMSRAPLAHLKLVLSNDTDAESCQDSIEQWFDFYEGFSVREIDFRNFSKLRGNFDSSAVRMSLVAGFMTGTSADVQYQFITKSGKCVGSLTDGSLL